MVTKNILEFYFDISIFEQRVKNEIYLYNH